MVIVGGLQMTYQDYLSEMRGDPLRGLPDSKLGTQISEALHGSGVSLEGILSKRTDGPSADAGPLGGFGKVKGARSRRNRCRTDGSNIVMNSYPFGESTRKVCPVFVGVASSGAASIGDVLKQAERHCWEMERQSNQFQRTDKTVLILTDKWDTAMFRRDFRSIFLHYALRLQVLFLFVLVTDDGVSRIPFLPWDRRELGRLSQQLASWELPDEEKSWNQLIFARGCRYCVVHRSQQSMVETVYYINFMDRTYNKEVIIHAGPVPDALLTRERDKSGDIPVQALWKFAAGLYDLAQISEGHHREDPPKLMTENESVTHILELLGREIQWGVGEGAFQKYREAVEALLHSIERKPRAASAGAP